MFLVNLLITKRDTLSRITAVLGHANVCLQIMGFKFVITTFKLSADMRIGSKNLTCGEIENDDFSFRQFCV